MNDTRSRVLLVVDKAEQLDSWVQFAGKIAGEGGEVLLRGIVTVPEGQSLSEGVTSAQQLRDAIRAFALDMDNVHNGVEVRVDYRPMSMVLDEIRALECDLMLAQWAGPIARTGGMTTDEILRHAPCDVVLLHGTTWVRDEPVLLSLRGGPNATLGIRVAEALADDSTVTLFHVADRVSASRSLQSFVGAHPIITRTVTAVSDIGSGILHELTGHKALVMGATFRQPESTESASGPVIQRIYDRTSKPLVLVRAWHPEELEFHAPLPRLRAFESLSTRVDRWFAENTFHSREFEDLRALLTLKQRQGVTISLGLPALNEEKTVGNVIRTIKGALMDALPLLDEIVLIDSNSTDKTAQIAEMNGVPVYRHSEILPETGSFVGKGEALWKSLHVLNGDIIAWIDTDITNIHPRFVYGLLGPLLKRSQVQYVKGFYQRPIRVGDQLQAYGGGRVTELVARPLFNLFYPELSGIIQPLSGEYAGRRTALEQLPFFSGYGVETGMLIDMLEKHGLDAIAQTDLEERVHHNQPLVGLSKMAFAILQVFIARLENRYDVHLLDHANRSLKMVAHGPDRFALDLVEIGDTERPPMITVPAYRERHLTTP